MTRPNRNSECSAAVPVCEPGQAGADAFTIMRLMGRSTVGVSQRDVYAVAEAVDMVLAPLAALDAALRFKVGTTAAGESAEVR